MPGRAGGRGEGGQTPLAAGCRLASSASLPFPEERRLEGAPGHPARQPLPKPCLVM